MNPILFVLSAITAGLFAGTLAIGLGWGIATLQLRHARRTK